MNNISNFIDNKYVEKWAGQLRVQSNVCKQMKKILGHNNLQDHQILIEINEA
jgi:hypothetical protein